MENKYKFNGYEQQSKEFIDGWSLEWNDYKNRFYDYQTGRFFCVDKLADEYRYYSTYQFAGNQVPNAIDVDGLEPDKPYYSAGLYIPQGRPESYATKAGHYAEKYIIKEFGKPIWVTKIYTDETVKGIGGTYPGTTYYFISDPSSKNSENTVSNNGSTEFKTSGTNWQFWMTNHQLSEQFKQTEGVRNIILASFAAGATMPYTIPAGILASPYLSTASRYAYNVLKPQAGFNPSGAAWDFINQKFIQGRDFSNINWGSTLTSGMFGGGVNGNLLSNSLWAASGNFTNLSINGILDGQNPLNFSKASFNSFASNAAGNLFSNGANKIFRGFNGEIIINTNVKNFMNNYMRNAMEGTGQILSTVLNQSIEQ